MSLSNFDVITGTQNFVFWRIINA